MQTLVEVLTCLDDLSRERLGQLRVWTDDPWQVECVPHPSAGEPFGGPLDAEGSLLDQAEALGRSGLVGSVQVAATPDADGAWTVHFWAGEQERAAWSRRMELCAAAGPAQALLAAAGRVKVARRELDRVTAQLRRETYAASAGEYSLGAADLACLAQWEVTSPPLHPSPSSSPRPASPDPASSAPSSPPRRPPGPGRRATRPGPGADTAADEQRPRHNNRRTTPQQGGSAPRFEAPAAALDAECLYLPDGVRAPWQALHLGEIALLAVSHRLGHGGGRTLPNPGELWLYPDAMESLGLPIDLQVDDTGDRSTRDAARRDAFAPLAELPVVAAALTDGWVIGQHGRLGPRTYLRHPERLPQGANIVFLPWLHTVGIPLLTETDDDGEQWIVEPDVLVDRLAEFAHRVGVTYRVRPGVTGDALIDHTRPPRPADAPDEEGAKTVRRAPAELPPFLRVADARFEYVERDFSWWRRWDSLTSDERARRYVHAYDHRSHYLNAWSNTSLGIDGLVHRTGAEARWGGDEKAAYYLVDRWDEDWPDWTLPDPLNACGAVVDGDRVWVSAHTLRQLDKLAPGLTESIGFHEVWTWTRQVPYLSVAGRRLAAARAEGSPPVADTVKQVYAVVSTKLASRDAGTDRHLYRPDWRDMLVAAARTAIVATVLDARQQATPLAISRDTIIWASDDPDPRSAWPGRPDKLDSVSGGWRPIGSALLDEWGPQALEDRRYGVWDYRRHVVDGLSGPGRFCDG